MVKWVTAHMASGDFPALVTQEFDGGSVCLAIFTHSELVFRQNVMPYVFDADDEPEDRVGFYSE